MFLISLTQSRSLKSGAALEDPTRRTKRNAISSSSRLFLASRRETKPDSRNVTSQPLPRMTLHSLLDESSDLGVPEGDEGGGGRGEARDWTRGLFFNEGGEEVEFGGEVVD